MYIREFGDVNNYLPFVVDFDFLHNYYYIITYRKLLYHITYDYYILINGHIS